MVVPDPLVDPLGLNAESAVFVSNPQPGTGSVVLPLIGDNQQVDVQIFIGSAESPWVSVPMQITLPGLPGSTHSPRPGNGLPATPTNFAVGSAGPSGTTFTWSGQGTSSSFYDIYGVTSANTDTLVLGGISDTANSATVAIPSTVTQAFIVLQNSVNFVTEYSSYSNFVGVGLVNAPSAPQNLVAYPVDANGTASINLVWDNNSNNETGYAIQREDLSQPAATWTTIATNSWDQTSFSDATISASDVYDYRILALNGAQSPSSSNTALAWIAPLVSAISINPSSAAAGTLMTFSATATPSAQNGDILHYQWSLVDPSNPGSPQIFNTASPTLSYSPPDAGNWTASLTVNDVTLSLSTTVGPQPFTVTAAPSLQISGPNVASEGTVVNYALNNGASATSWTAVLNGTQIASGSGTQFSFTPETPGQCVVQAIVNSGGMQTVTENLTVSYVTPTVTIAGSATGFVGHSMVFGSTVTQAPGVNDQIGYQWQLLNADGSQNQYSNTSNPPLPTYVAPGTLGVGNYEVKLTATDGALSTVTATFAFSVLSDPSSNNFSWGIIPQEQATLNRPDAIIQQSNGQIVVAGDSATQPDDGGPYAYIARLNPDLSLDTSFGPDNTGAIGDVSYGPEQNGIVTVPFELYGDSHIFALAINPTNQDIIAVGEFDNLSGAYLGVVEYVGTDRIDTTVGPNLGKMLLPGTPDPDFNSGNAVIFDDGYQTESGAWAVAVTSQASQGAAVGSIYVGGMAETAPTAGGSYAIQDFMLLRLTPQGALDPTFNPSGSVPGVAQQVNATGKASAPPFDSNNSGVPLNGTQVIQAGITDLILRPNGQIIAGGYADRGASVNGDIGFELVRYNSNGTLDLNFGTNGQTFTSSTAFNNGTAGQAVLGSMAIVGDNILVAGVLYGTNTKGSGAYVVLAEYQLPGTSSDGILNNSYGSNGTITTSVFDSAEDISEDAAQGDPNAIPGDPEYRLSTGPLETESNGQIIGSIETSNGWELVDIIGDDGNSSDSGKPYSSFGNNGVVGTSPGLSLSELNGATAVPQAPLLSNAVLVTSQGILLTGALPPDEGTETSNWANSTPVVVRYNSLTNPFPSADNFAAVSTSDGVTLTWSNNGFGQDGFEVDRATTLAALQSSSSLIATVGPTQDNYVDDTASPDTTYFYQVLPFFTNDAGSPQAGSATNVATVHTLPDSTTDYVLQEIVQVPLGGSEVTSSTVLQLGKTYLIVASGDISLNGSFTADAGYWYDDANSTILGTTFNGVTNGVAIADDIGSASQPTPSVPDWGLPNTNGHTYTMAYVGNGYALNFQYDAAAYPAATTNQNDINPLQVEIYALPSVAVAPTPPAAPSGQPALAITVPTSNGSVIPSVLGSPGSVNVLAANSNGTQVPWALSLISSTGVVTALASSNTSIGQLPDSPAFAITLDPALFPSGIYTLSLATTYASPQTNYSTSIKVALERPVVQIVSPPAWDAGLTPTISSNTQLNIIAANPDGTAVPWTLWLVPSTGSPTQLASGTTSAGQLPDGAIPVAMLNPSFYANGQYTLKLTTNFANTQDNVVYNLPVNIETAVKTGSLVLPVTDGTFTTPAGDVQITRVFNSANTNLTSYFGPGWTLGMLDAQLSTTAQADALDPTQTTPVLRAGDLVYLTVPNDGQHVFEFDPQVVSETANFAGSETSIAYIPRFIAVDGSGATLTFLSDSQMNYVMTYDAADNEFVATFEPSGIPLPDGLIYQYETVGFNPAHDMFGLIDYNSPVEDYQLTTKDGTTYLIDANSGQIQSVMNSNGSTTTYNYGTSTITATDNGKTVLTIALNSNHEITSIQSPGQNAILYNYSNGLLSSVQNLEGNETFYSYQDASQPDYLTGASNSQGQTILQAQYGAIGQLQSLTNANGITTPISFVALGNNQAAEVVTDALGDVTENIYNEVTGNLLRKIQTVTDGSGNVLDYIVTVNSYSYVTDDVAAMSALRNSGISVLQSVQNYAPFEIAGTDLTGLRFTEQPTPGSWVSQTVFDTSNDPDDAGRQQVSSTSIRLDAAGDLQTTLYEDYTAIDSSISLPSPFNFSIKLDNPKPQLVTVEIQKVDTASGSGDDNFVQSNTYTGYDTAGNLLYTLTGDGVQDPNNPANSLAEGTLNLYGGEGNVPSESLMGTEKVIASIPPGVVTNLYNDLAEIANQTTNYYYTLQDAYGPSLNGVNAVAGALYGLEKYTINAAGQETYYAYNGMGEPVLTYTYKEWTAPNGNPEYGWVGTTDAYNSLGQLTDSYEATYTDPNAVGSGNDGNIGQAQTLFTTTDSSGNVIVDTSRDPVYSAPVRTVHNDYNAIGQKIDSIDQYGGETIYTYDGNGNLIRTVNPDGTEIRSVYDALNRVIWTTTNPFVPANGNPASPNNVAVVTHTIYNQLGQVIETDQYQNIAIEITGGNEGSIYVASSSVPASQVTSANLVSKTLIYYNAQGQVAETISPSGLSTGTIYYPDGQVQYSGPLQSGAIASGASAWYNNLPADQSDGTLSSTYLSSLFLQSQTPWSTYSQYTINKYDQVNGAIVATATLANFTMPAVGATATVNVGSTSKLSVGEYVSISSAGGFIISSISNGTTLVLTNLGYNPLASGTNTAAGTSISSGSNVAIPGLYDAVIDANGNETDTYKDSQGRVIKTVYPDGSFTETLYSIGNTPVTKDLEGDTLQTSPTPPSIPTGDVSETVQIGQRKSGIGESIVSTYNMYNAAGELTDVYEAAVIDGNPADTTYNTTVNPHQSYQYDASGDNTVQISPDEQLALQAWQQGGHTAASFTDDTQFAYDQFGNEVSHTLPDGEKESFTYNQFNQESTHTDFDGNVSTYTYYPAGNVHEGMLEQVVYAPPSGSSLPSQTDTYSYTPLGQQYQVNDASGMTTYSYDIFGNQTQAVTPEGTINYVYDPATQNHIETYTSNTDTHYMYDNQGRMTEVEVTEVNGQTLATPLVTTYSYDNVGNKVSETLPDGELTNYYYDGLNRLSEITERQGSTALFTQSLYPNDNGTLGQMIENELEPDGTSLVNNGSTRLDGLGRVTREVSANTDGSLSYTDVYTYDLDGNRMSSVHTGPGGGANETINYSYNDDDQLISQTSSLSGTTTSTYDANGSLITQTSGSNVTTYTYDVRNKMVGYAVNGVTLATYVYDDAGNRVAETAGGVPTLYLTDTANPTGYDQPLEAKTSATGTPSMTYILGDRVLGQVNSGGTVTYLLVDGHGSTRMLTNSSGTETALLTYNAFGTAMNFTASSAGTVFLFGGDAVYDPVSGLYMNGDGVRDRFGFEFIQMDPTSGNTQDPISLHKYLYADADPVNGNDPSGFDDNELEDEAFSEADEDVAEDVAGYTAVDVALTNGITEADISEDQQLAIGSLAISVYQTYAQAWQTIAQNIFLGAAGAFLGQAAEAFVAADEGTGGAGSLQTLEEMGEVDSQVAAAEGATSGTALASQLGRAGENAANIIKNTERIASITGTATYRIPDILEPAANLIGEVKNVARLSFTSQIQDSLYYALEKGYTFVLVVRQSTTFTAPLQALIDAGFVTVQRSLP